MISDYFGRSDSMSENEQLVAGSAFLAGALDGLALRSGTQRLLRQVARRIAVEISLVSQASSYSGSPDDAKEVRRQLRCLFEVAHALLIEQEPVISTGARTPSVESGVITERSSEPLLVGLAEELEAHAAAPIRLALNLRLAAGMAGRWLGDPENADRLSAMLESAHAILDKHVHEPRRLALEKRPEIARAREVRLRLATTAPVNTQSTRRDEASADRTLWSP